MDLKNVLGWIVIGFVGLAGVILLWKMATDKINLTMLISEENGDASISRFQLLIFTFVIAISLFEIIVSKTPPEFPQIPADVLALLGISGGSYLVSKGIQTSKEINKTNVAAQAATDNPAPIAEANIQNDNQRKEK